MTPSFASRALLVALFLGAAISSNVLAAPTPISPLSMSSNPASTGVQPAQPSSESAFGQGSLSSRGPPEVDVPMVQRRELVHDVESTVPTQFEYGDDLDAVSEVFKSDQDGTEDVTDPNASVSFVNLKHRGGFLSTPAPTPEVTLTDEHKKTLIPILERWVKMVKKYFNRRVKRDAKNLELIINKKKGRDLDTALKNFSVHRIFVTAQTALKLEPERELSLNIREMATSNTKLLRNKEVARLIIEGDRKYNRGKNRLSVDDISQKNTEFRDTFENMKLETLLGTFSVACSSLGLSVPQDIEQTAWGNFVTSGTLPRSPG
ncbi:hypothetical protein EV360DRAFT_72903 [Lentinula raphanica]|nr:hypothetical protein EV360DRAFT_72903 [Lentinula raphanica]